MSYFPFTVLLSASVPSSKRSIQYQEEYTKIKNAQIQIEEAVIALTRNIFQKHGRIVFAGHPSISPLVTLVATEFSLNKEIENIHRKEESNKPITIFQSRAFEEVLPKSTNNLYNLGYSNIIWTEIENNEKYNYKIQGQPQCEKSLALMRNRMIYQNLDAMVCIGGMEGVELEFDLFRKFHPNKPIFLLNSTGGATSILASKYSNDPNIKLLNEEKYMNQYISNEKHESKPLVDIIPYSFITALLVNQILESKN